MESKILVKRREISFDHFSLRLPTYLMTIFPIPAKVEERIDAIRRNFLWNGEKEYKGFHLVEWKTVILSKK